jgi:hypothetical protein
MRLLACCENCLKEKKKSLSQQTSLFDFFNSSSGTGSLPFVLLDIGDDDPGNHPLCFKIAFMGKSISTRIVWTNVAGLRTTCEVILWDGCIIH